jgi:hypothetical protein
LASTALINATPWVAVPPGWQQAGGTSALFIRPSRFTQIHKSFSLFILCGEAKEFFLTGTTLAFDAMKGRSKKITNCARNLPASQKRSATMYELLVYSITDNLWRWEIRSEGALIRCGTAPTRTAAETNAYGVANA